jgi:hypothetical protein
MNVLKRRKNADIEDFIYLIIYAMINALIIPKIKIMIIYAYVNIILLKAIIFLFVMIKELIVLLKDILIHIMRQMNVLKQKKIVFRIIIKFLMINVIMIALKILKIKVMIIFVYVFIITLIKAMNSNALMRKIIAYLKVIIIHIMKQKSALRQKKIALKEDIKFLIKNVMMNVHQILKIKIIIIYANAYIIFIMRMEY